MGMMVNGFSVFLIPLNDEFGWQRGSVSLINLSGLMGLALGGIVMGRIADKKTTRIVILCGATVLTCSGANDSPECEIPSVMNGESQLVCTT